MFYQVMKKIYTAFQEMLFVDATDKVNELWIPLYIFLTGLKISPKSTGSIKLAPATL